MFTFSYFGHTPFHLATYLYHHLHNREINGKVHIDDELRERMLEYLAEYGPKDHAV